MRFLLLSILLIHGVAAAAPWIADISEAAVSPHESSVAISLPTGERTAVGVYEADRIDVRCPEGVTAETFTQCGYWLSTDRWRPAEKAGGPYVVRLHATKAGDHNVFISCDGGAVELSVRLTVTAPVAKSDIGFGYYFVPAYFQYPDQWRLYFETMRDMGCNTFTIYEGYPDLKGEPGANIAWQMDLAVEVGLSDGKTPVFVLCHSPARLDAAYELGQRVSEWPPLYGYGKDEPGLASEADARGMVTMFNNSGKRPYKSGSAISSSASIMKFGDGMDVWIVLMSTMSDIIKRRAAAMDKELWAYCCELRGTNAPLNRYMSGLWAFKNRPRCLMSWVAFDTMTHSPDVKVPSCVHPDGRWTPCGYYEYLLQAPDGPLSSLGAEGRRDGTVDYRVLRELERVIETSTKFAEAEKAAHWLQDVVDRVDTNFWPRDEVPWGSGTNGEPLHWVLKDTALPVVTDFNAIRAKALTYIGGLR